MSREDPQMRIRLPADVKAWISLQAQVHSSSQNSEVVRCIRERMLRSENDNDGAKLPGTPRHRPHAGDDRPVSTEL